MNIHEWLETLRFDSEAEDLAEIHNFEVHDEHGRSWAICKECGASYSINFANVNSEDCFVLEQVSEGDDEYACGREEDEEA